MRPLPVQSTQPNQQQSSANIKSWLSRLTNKNISQITTNKQTAPSSPPSPVSTKDCELETLKKSRAPVIQLDKTSSLIPDLNELSALWDTFSDDPISEEDTNLILEPLDNLKPLEFDVEEATIAPKPSLVTNEITWDQQGESIENDDFLIEKPASVLEAPPVPNELHSLETTDTIDEDLKSLLNSFDEPINTGLPPSPTEVDVEASNEEISSFLASFAEEENSTTEESIELKDSRVHPEIVEFDDENLEQQIDDLLDDMILNVTAVKTTTPSAKPITNSVVVDDDIEIEFEFDIVNDNAPQQKPTNQPEPNKKDPARLRRYGGFLSEFDSIEGDTETIALTRKNKSTRSDELMNLLGQVEQSSGEAVEQRLSNILTASGDSQEVKELCDLVAQAYGINSQFLNKSESDDQQSETQPKDPLSPLKRELDHQLDLLLSKGFSISTDTTSQTHIPEAEKQSPVLPSSTEPKDNEDIEQLLKELGDKTTPELEIEIAADQKKTAEPITLFSANTSCSIVVESPKITTNDATATLWLTLEEEIENLSTTPDLDVEIDICEVMQFKPNDKTTLFFDLLEEEILSPTKKPKSFAVSHAPKNTQIENKLLTEALQHYDQEVKDIATLKAEGKYIDHKRKVISPTYRAPALWRRICAGLLDFTLHVLITITIGIIFFIPWNVKMKFFDSSSFEAEYLVPHIADIFATIFLSWLIVEVTLIFSQGKSFGQKLMRLELQNPNAATISFSQAFIYTTTQMFSSLFFFIGFLGVFGRNHKTLHDYLSGLVVSSSVGKAK